MIPQTNHNAFTRAATLAPTSWNAEARTVDVTFSTGADVQRFDAKGPFVERLDMGGVDLSRLIGASVLNAHRQSSLGDIIGVVLRATKKGIATLQLSAREDVAPFVADIAQGLIRHLSISYRVLQWRESVDPKSGVRIKTATRWQPHEISFVPVPADFGATTRGAKMDPEIEDAPENPTQVQPSERAQRNTAIRALCDTNGMTRAFADALIDGEGDLIAARAEVNAELQRRTPRIRTQGGVDHSDPSAIIERRAGALYARGAGVAPAEASREFFHDTFADHARWALQAGGQQHRGLNVVDVLARAMMTTSNFPLILENVVNKALEAPYAVNRSQIVTKLARQKTLSNFHPQSILRVGEIGPLQDLSESGEFAHSGRTEEKNTLALESGGLRIDYSGKMLTQDDAGAFVDAPAQFGGISAPAWENSKVLALFAGNPTLGDGKDWFDATRDPSNLDAGNTPISIEALSQAKLAMRKTTGLDGVTILDIAPAFLLVSAELEDIAIQFMSAYNAQFWSETNPHKLEILVEPRLPAYEWFVFGSPARAPCIDVATLAGQSAPRVTSRESWDQWGISFRCLHHFGCAAVSARGAYKFADGEPDSGG